jgi:hypothetical protein
MSANEQQHNLVENCQLSGSVRLRDEEAENSSPDVLDSCRWKPHYDHLPGAALPLSEGPLLFLVKTTFWRYYSGKGVVGFRMQHSFAAISIRHRFSCTILRVRRLPMGCVFFARYWSCTLPSPKAEEALGEFSLHPRR